MRRSEPDSLVLHEVQAIAENFDPRNRAAERGRLERAL